MTSEVLKERLTKIMLTIAKTNEKDASALTSASGIPYLSATMTARHFYSIIGRPIQSLLSQRTAKSGCLSPCKRARAS